MKRFFLLLAASLFVFASCTKSEGEGGKASIEGKVYVISYLRGDSNVLDTVPAIDEDVCIVYGNGSLQDDDTKTNYEGRFRFSYLRPGDYSIYVYGRNPDAAKVKMPQVFQVSVGKKENNIIPDIYIYGASDGHSSASGRVFVKDYDTGGLPKGVEYWGGEVNVYIARKGENTYFERTRTHYDGTFTFSRLSRGSYCVYTYSRDVTKLPPSGMMESVVQEFEIVDFAQSVTLETLTIID